jgi:HD superfamily phosphodiesterase
MIGLLEDARGEQAAARASYEAALDVVEASALLHDIGHAAGRAEHAQRGAALAATTVFSNRRLRQPC